jgi:acetyltransferase
MKLFMEPESVALVGITRKTGPGSFNLMETMVQFGYEGKIFAINPNAQEILGRKTYPNVRDVKEKIDLAVITVPRESTLEILEDCAAAGIRAVIIVNQGFTDADPRGKELQEAILRIGANKGMRILGPNTLGVLNAFKNFTTSFMPVSKERIPVGLICQSGIHFVGPAQFAGPFGKGVDLGNAGDIGFYDALKYLAEDPDIKVIAIHMEGLNQGKDFFELAATTVKKKPIVIHKTGSSTAGARAAMSHTGSLAGNYLLTRDALAQAGITVLEESGHMAHAVKTLLNLPFMRGNRVGMITYSGGAGIMASDALERQGMRLVPYSRETIAKVAELSPGWLPLGNPLDIWPAVMVHGAQKACRVALGAVLKDPNVDAILCVAISPPPEFPVLDVAETLNEVIEESAHEKPVILWTYGPGVEEGIKKFEARKKIMTYPSIETAAWALSLLKKRRE